MGDKANFANFAWLLISACQFASIAPISSHSIAIFRADKSDHLASHDPFVFRAG